MTKLKLFLKSIGYSVKLIYHSSGILMLVYLLLNLSEATITLFSAFAIKYILDNLVGGAIRINVLLLWIVLYVVSLVLRQVNISVKSILYDSIFQKAEHLYDCNLLDKLAGLSLSVIDSSKGRDMIEDVRYTKNTAVYTAYRAAEAISLFYTFIVAYIVIARFNIWFSLIFLVLTIPGIILNLLFDIKSEELRRSKAPDVRRFSYYRWMLTDAWPAKDVRMYDLTESVKARYKEEKDKYVAANKALDKRKAALLILAEAVQRSGEIIFIVFVVYTAIAGKISIGDVALYISLALTISDSFAHMLFVLTMGCERAANSMGRLFEFLNIKTDGEKENCRPLHGFESITFENVYFKYPYTENYVLSGVSFTMNKGEKMSIIGINGAGKSTIIKLMLGLYQIDSGQILINGYPMSDYDIRQVRGLFSVLFQSFAQYHLTLRENVAMSSLENIENDAEIERALAKSGIFENNKLLFEDGLESNMTRQFDDKGIELSRGQWQKIALARAYFKNAPIVIFDEPSAALDAEAEDRIFKDFQSLSDSKTAIMISHRISSARMSDKIIVLDNGSIIEEGTHDQLIKTDGLYAKMYHLQHEKYIVKEEVV